jgi:LCP family protein required for cell wall assembly
MGREPTDGDMVGQAHGPDAYSNEPTALLGAGGGPRRPGRPRGSRNTPGNKWARIAVIAGAALVALSLIFVGGLVLVNAFANSKFHTEPLLPSDPQGKDISGPINILLLGMDERTGETDLIHADSIIIVHVNAAHTKVDMVSIPRDSMVSVPAFPASKFPGTDVAKLTEAFAFGNRKFNAQGGAIGDDSAAGRARGVQLLASVLSNLTPGGLKFNAVAIVNFDGFQKIVEAMGGIDNMCVDETTLSEHYDNKGNYVSETHGNPKTAKTYPQGCYPMKPWEALDFVRQRHYLANGDGDYGRQRHQQQFLMTVFKQMSSAKTLTDPAKLTGVINAAGSLFTMDLGGNSVLDWVFTLKGLNSDDITMIKTNGGKYASVTINGTDYEKVVPDTINLLGAVHNDAVDQFLATHPTWISNLSGPTASPTTPPSN